MSCEIQLIFDEARTALERLKRGNTLKDWLIAGTALVVIQTSAMAAAHTNKPAGRRYCTEVGAMLKEQGLDEIDKGTRSRLLDVMQNRPVIEAWLVTLEIPKRLKMNHPTTVLSAWKRSIAPPKEEEEEPKPKSELCGILKGYTAEERRVANDDLGFAFLYEALSPGMLAKFESKLANPHTINRLAEKTAQETQAVEAAKKEMESRAPKRGNVTDYYNEPAAKSRRTVKSAVMKDIGNWRKFDLETLRAAIAQEQHRSAYDERDKGGLTPAECGRLDKMKKQEKVLAKTVASQGNTAAGVRSNGNGVPPGESAAAMMAAHAAADAAGKPFKKSINL